MKKQGKSSIVRYPFPNEYRIPKINRRLAHQAFDSKTASQFSACASDMGHWLAGKSPINRGSKWENHLQMLKKNPSD
jgi:hypothetical protein